MKYAWIKQNKQKYQVTRMCALLTVSRSGFVQWLNRGQSKRQIANESLDAKVYALHSIQRRGAGRPRLVKALHSAGFTVGHERVRQSLLRQGLRTVYKRAYKVTTDSDHALTIAKNHLDRQFNEWPLNRAWVGDITYISTAEGWLYLAVVIDLCSRKVVGWSMSSRINAQLTIDALMSAFGQRNPPPGLIMHTDRGSQYASEGYRQALKKYGMKASMSRKGNCWDNAVAESFFKTLKVEQIYQTHYRTRDHARLDIVNWIEGFYNESRMHSANDNKTPNQLERELMAA